MLKKAIYSLSFFPACSSLLKPTFPSILSSHVAPPSANVIQLRGYTQVSTNKLEYQRKQLSECWNCNPRNFKSNLVVCGSCHHLQNPNEGIMSMNYFSLFNMSAEYQIDSKELSHRYKELQKTFHPDKFYTLRNKKVLEFSENYSRYINEGFSILKDDLSRAEYLINLLTGGKREELEMKVDTKDIDLQQIMMLRMEIEECEDESQLMLIQNKLMKDKEFLCKGIEYQLKQRKFEKAAVYLIKMRYIQSALSSIKQVAEALLSQK